MSCEHGHVDVTLTTSRVDFLGLMSHRHWHAGAAAAFERFPKLQCVASAIRTPLSAHRHDLSAVMIERRVQETISPAHQRDSIVDCVGGGDAFAAGLLNTRLDGRDGQSALDFAVAASCLKHSIARAFNLASPPPPKCSIAEELDVRR